MQNIDKHFPESQKSLLSWPEWGMGSGSKKNLIF